MNEKSHENVQGSLGYNSLSATTHGTRATTRKPTVWVKIQGQVSDRPLLNAIFKRAASF